MEYEYPNPDKYDWGIIYNVTDNFFKFLENYSNELNVPIKRSYEEQFDFKSQIGKMHWDPDEGDNWQQNLTSEFKGVIDTLRETIENSIHKKEIINCIYIKQVVRCNWYITKDWCPRPHVMVKFFKDIRR